MSVKNEGFLHLEFSMISSLNDSYRTIISVYGCDPILSERTNEFVEYSNWEKVENHLRDILQNSVNKTSLSKDVKEKYFMSATEHEVIEGIFKYNTFSRNYFTKK